MPPPPAGVEELAPQTPTARTLRERLEQHRQDPACFACHQALDPIGFGLENFDAIGGWRTHDHGELIDSSGELPSGELFSGAEDLAAILSRDSRFSHCLAEKLMTYAIGRGMDQPSDGHWVPHVAASAAASGNTLRELIVSIVLSEPFRMRRGGER